MAADAVTRKTRAMSWTSRMTFAGAVAACTFAGVAHGAVTERVSVSSSGTQGTDISGRLSRPAVNADGRIVAFDSLAPNLVPDDGNRTVDIFVRDRDAGTTERVSVNNRGKGANRDASYPVISGDGRFVVFHSFASNLGADDPAVFDVFIRDRATGKTKPISIASDGTPGNGHSLFPQITPDGRFVSFLSESTNLDPRKTSFLRDVFVRDRKLKTTEVVDLADDDSVANQNATDADISGDGNLVAFGSFASNLVPNDLNDQPDVFVRNRPAGTTERVSVSSDELESNGPSYYASISADGRFVAFYSEATNLVPMDLNGVGDIFVRDLTAGTTERVSVSSHEEEADGQSNGPGIRGGLRFGPDISSDGRYVTFDSIATNLVPGDTNTCPPFYEDPPGVCPDVFVRDRALGTTRRVSLATDGTQGDRASTDPAISLDGLTIAFFSSATNLVAGDTNTCPPNFTQPGSCPDIFVRSRR